MHVIGPVDRNVEYEPTVFSSKIHRRIQRRTTGLDAETNLPANHPRPDTAQYYGQGYHRSFRFCIGGLFQQVLPTTLSTDPKATAYQVSDDLGIDMSYGLFYYVD